ncbi:hypothetical protein [Photobacterium carnosum]|uniref:50S ribosomal protein L33 n=1 Tax=Photobacterium carnosum TaxID=2023717 RepID=A0A2N4UUJ7_9GAMM|nr:hypothetical protein [Photobacterium carnosum]MCD9514623.1 hypothetical protein [Photobacterium carnosum]MCD9529311.1 hypothetical protein [Photobacterium carnosum]MCD9552615.1 hypothetical protein [Photobacterium carnosum]MCD9556961.1 hypothetical protein [Photobacterium carnosum]MCF2153712.1 hypothetical protein [Photobacterium carnosum]
MRLTRRGWNNVIIIGVLAFIAVIQLPGLIRARLTTPVASVPSPAVIPLFAQDRIIQRLLLPKMAFQHSVAGWESNPSITLDIATFIARWQTLAGTEVSEQQLVSLKSQLKTPRTVEAWLVGYSQPQRITAYQLPHFWLFNNGTGQWLAVTVDADFLFPRLSSKL